MKPGLSLVIMLLLLPGCTTSKRGSVATYHFAELPVATHEVPPPQPQSAPRGDPPLFIFVGGEFRNPGQFAWTNGMTLKDSIAAAGGFTDFAVSRIHLQHWDGSSERYKWNAKRPLTNNPALRPGDAVINPRQ